MSGGRAGWNIVTSAHAGAAANFGGSDLIPHNQRYLQAEEYLEVVRGLWDSWDDDAFPRDRASRRFADLEKMHVLDHHGAFFNVRGPLNLCRSAQGQPVTFQAGSSGDGRHFAARFAEGVFAREYDFESAKAFYADMKGRAAALGRNPAEMQIFQGAQIVVGRTVAEAEEKYEMILGYTSDADALKNLAYFYNHLDISGFDPDAPFPDLSRHGSNFFRGLTTKFAADAARLGLTLRQVARRVATLKEDFFGTPAQVADAMEAWFKGGAADGFLINNWVQPDGLRDFVELVVPELQRRGLYPNGYTGTTLRENLGLPFARSRYAEPCAVRAAS
jgi:FMN-dependent oxidoreductase (nitrilotriacetate monooxygenase family)